MKLALLPVGYLFLFLLTAASLGYFRRYAVKVGLVDQPNERSSHSIAKPRGGGLIFVSMWLLFVLALWISGGVLSKEIEFIFPATFIIALVGYLDDKHSLSAKVRFVVHLCVASYFIVLLKGYTNVDIGVTSLYLGWVGAIIAIIAMVWSINLYNFMDGIDGLAAIEAFFVYGVGGLLLWLAGAHVLAMLAGGLVACVMGFLFWNWPPAKIFMGDVGSVVLGFLIVPFAVLGEKWFDVPALLWLMLYSLFWFDATVTLVRRVWHKERWYAAHRSHAYQRILQAGWSLQKILFVFISANVVISTFVIVGNSHRQWLPWLILVDVLFCTFLYLLVERIKPMYQKEVK